MADMPYRFQIRLGNFSFEVEGDRNFVERTLARYEGRFLPRFQQLLTNYSDPRLAYLVMQLYSPPTTYLTSPWEEPIAYVYLLSSHRLLTPEQLQQALQPFPFALQELNTQL